jgi:hypothetical protein
MGNPSKYGSGVDDIKVVQKLYDIINCIYFLTFLFLFWCCTTSPATGLLLIVRISFARVYVQCHAFLCKSLKECKQYDEINFWREGDKVSKDIPITGRGGP